MRLDRVAEKADFEHLENFTRTRRGVEAFLEPRTTVTETTMMLVASMIPIAFGTGPGSGGRASMAKVIIGGQILCLLLTLLVTPVSYSIFDDWGGRHFKLFRRRAARKATGDGSATVSAPATY